MRISFSSSPPPWRVSSFTAWASTAPPSCMMSTGTHSPCGPEMCLLWYVNSPFCYCSVYSYIILATDIRHVTFKDTGVFCINHRWVLFKCPSKPCSECAVHLCINKITLIVISLCSSPQHRNKQTCMEPIHFTWQWRTEGMHTASSCWTAMQWVSLLVALLLPLQVSLSAMMHISVRIGGLQRWKSSWFLECHNCCSDDNIKQFHKNRSPKWQLPSFVSTVSETRDCSVSKYHPTAKRSFSFQMKIMSVANWKVQLVCKL